MLILVQLRLLHLVLLQRIVLLVIKIQFRIRSLLLNIFISLLRQLRIIISNNIIHHNYKFSNKHNINMHHRFLLHQLIKLFIRRLHSIILSHRLHHIIILIHNYLFHRLINHTI